MLDGAPSNARVEMRAERWPSRSDPESLPEWNRRGTVLWPMRSSLSLQRSLFKHQARQIAQQVQGASAHFRAYQRRYEAATRRFRRPIELSEVDARSPGPTSSTWATTIRCGWPSRRTWRCSRARSPPDDGWWWRWSSWRRGTRPASTPTWQASSRRRRSSRASGIPTADRSTSGRASRRSSRWRAVASWRCWRSIAAPRAPARSSCAMKRQPAHRPRVEGRRSPAGAGAGGPVSRGAAAPAPPGRGAAGDVEREALVVYQNAEGVYWSLARSGRVETTRAVEISERSCAW